MKTLMILTIRHIIVAVVLAAGLQSAKAAPAKALQEDSTRTYTKEHPLVYEDVWDLWPYSFLNDNGEPDGFNVDLIRLLMKDLDIPYVIKMKPSAEAFRDLQEGKSDLMLGLAVGFHDEFGHYSKNAVTLFTQSVVTPKNKPQEIKSFHDLGKHKVIVNDSSLCHHLMMDYGWGENAQPAEDMREAIQQVSAQEEGQIVWNTLSLKWLIRRYHIDNLELSPVNMPHGEYKFMSNDQHLLELLDDTYATLYSAEKLTPIQNKWFYPDRQAKPMPVWVPYVVGFIFLLAVIGAVYILSYNYQARRITRRISMHNSRLALILQTCHVHIWTYNILSNLFEWRNDNGQVAYTYSMEEFAQRYRPEDYPKLKAALEKLSSQTAATDAEEEIHLNLRAKDTEGGDTEERDYYIVLSVFERDKSGKPTMIIGIKKDVTEERTRQRQANERTQRYWAIFNTPLACIMLFDRNGILTNINPAACEMFQADHDDIISQRISIDDLLDTGNLDIAELDGYYATQVVDIDRIPMSERKVTAVKRRGKLYNEFRMVTVYDDGGELLGAFAICRDISETVSSARLEQEGEAQVTEIRSVLDNYDKNINRVVGDHDVRIASYHPKSHTLSIYNSTTNVQHALTQTRCMTLVDDRSKNQAMRMLNEMDDLTGHDFDAYIRTTLRIKGGNRLVLRFMLTPIRDNKGKVVEYFGLCQDISELRHIEHLTAMETAKLQEVENTKNSFIKNMVQEIRTPMNRVVKYVEQLNPTEPSADEPDISQGILTNADYLLHLIDNILYLSRLEANMVEIKKQPRDFSEIFESQCAQGWSKYMNDNTRYIVENPYSKLVVDIDAENLGLAIAQLTANAAQHTQKGTIRTRYDYIGRQLTIYIDDTGEGMSAEEVARINQMGVDGAHNSKGLGLAISKEIVRQMGGSLEVSSEEGYGTTVYIIIPCHASEVRRKKVV